MNATEEKYADRIRKLLMKAESTTPAEAEALVSKAQELMTRYAISEMMIEESAGKHKDEITTEEFVFVGIFRVTAAQLFLEVMYRNNGRAVQYTDVSRVVDGKEYRQTIVYKVVAFKSDIERMRMLYSSLYIQQVRALTVWAKTNIPEWASKSNSYKSRRDFGFGFAYAVGDRLRAAQRAGQQAAAQDEAERQNVTTDEASASVELVLRSRKDTVDDWFDQTYGNLRQSRSRSYENGSFGGHGAGRSAGSRADIGQPGLRTPAGLTS